MDLKNVIKVIAFDADDTLWENQPYFDEVEERFCLLMSDYGDVRHVKEELFSTEMQNMYELGYGATAFTLSMIETALNLGGKSLPSEKISEVYSLGRSLLRIPATPLPGVRETLENISRSGLYRLIVVSGLTVKGFSRI